MAGRSTTAAFLTEVANNSITPRLLIEAQFTSGTIYVWNGIGNLSWNSQTWSGLGEFLTISNVIESSDLRVAGLTIQFSALSSQYKTLALSQVELDNTVKIYFALLDSSGVAIADPETVFIGKMDQVTLSESAAGTMFDLEVSNRLVELYSSSNRRYTHHDQQQIDATDNGCRHILNADKEIKWGSDRGV